MLNESDLKKKFAIHSLIDIFKRQMTPLLSSIVDELLKPYHETTEGLLMVSQLP
jgi:hypothetical protein